MRERTAKETKAAKAERSARRPGPGAALVLILFLMALSAAPSGAANSAGMVDAGAPNVSSLDGDALRSARERNAEEIKRAIGAGANLKARDVVDGKSPLMWAANNNDIPVISLLLEKGANIGSEDKDGLTPFLYAALGGQSAEVLSFLLERGADATERDYSGKSALMLAAQAGEAGVMSFLLDKGADTKMTDGDGKRAFDLLPEEKPAKFGDEEWEAVKARLAK